MTHKKPSLKSVAKKAIGEVRQVTEKTEFSSKFEDVFDMDYSAPLPKSHKKARGHLSAQVLGITTVLTSIFERIECMEYKVDIMEKACSSRLDRMDLKHGEDSEIQENG